MITAKHRVIGAGLSALHGSGLSRRLAPWFRGRGAILTFHRVTTPVGDGFAPNQGLEIAPAFLDNLIGHLAGHGYHFVPLLDVPALLHADADERPFLALTFDDGYRDTVTAALPVLERHGAPFTVFATTGFLDRTARLWWVELEQAIRRLNTVIFRGRSIPTATAHAKRAAFDAITAALLAGDDDTLLAGVGNVARQAGLSGAGVVDALCLDWDGLKALAEHPLAQIGCHTLTHPRLARLSAPHARAEMAQARVRLERELGRPVPTFCYPYGMRAAAGTREFGLAAALGFTCAVTTRPGVLHPAHADSLTALPRVSVNGFYQSLAAVDVLLSGAGFALWNGFKRVVPIEAISAAGRSRPDQAAPSSG